MAPTPEEQSSLQEDPVSPELTSKFKEILKSNGITEPVSEVIVKDSGLRGENMASVTKYVTVKFEGDKKSPLNLFIKQHSTSETHNAMVGEARLFEKEAQFFMEYLPMAEACCKKLGKENLLSIYPKCYYGDEKLMVFENLVLDRDYCILNKMERQGIEAATMSIENLAKHHAISVAVISENGGPASFFKKYAELNLKIMLAPALIGFIEPGVKSGQANAIKVLKKCGLARSEEIIRKLEDLQEKGLEPILETLKNDSSNCMVLNHGDYWNNNMMFLKDPQTGKLIDHIAIDFQGIYHGSPAMDLGYFLFTSVKPSVRKENLLSLFRKYLEALKVTANELGHPVDLTLEELYESYCKNFKFGFFFGNFLMSEVGMTMMKDVDINEIGDMAEFIANFDNEIEKWLAAHPEKCQEFAEAAIENMDEFEQLENRVHKEELLRSH